MARRSKRTVQYAKKKYKYRFKCERCGNESGWQDNFITVPGIVSGVRNQKRTEEASNAARQNLEKRLENINSGKYYMLNDDYHLANLKRVIHHSKGKCPSCLKAQSWAIHLNKNQGGIILMGICGFALSGMIAGSMCGSEAISGVTAWIIILATTAFFMFLGLRTKISNKRIMQEMKNIKEKQIPEIKWDSDLEILKTPNG
jgi:transcription elongation factor Elf1